MAQEPTLESSEEASSSEDTNAAEIQTGGFSGTESIDEPTPEPEKTPEPTPPKPTDGSCKLNAVGEFANGIASCEVKKTSKIDLTRVQQLILDVDGIKYTFVKQ